MASALRKSFTSEKAKRIYIALAILMVLSFLCNDFVMPWYVNRGGSIEVPIVAGMEYSEAKHLLDSMGMETRRGDVRMDKERKAGLVMNQNPPAGSIVKRNRRIYLTISGGEPLVQVPGIIGRTLRDARFALEREGLRLGAIEYQPSDLFPPNTVIEQKLKPGARVRMDVYVSVIVSEGKTAEKVPVPDLSGKTLAEAEKILAKVGLTTGNITYIPSMDLLPNTVVDQYPRNGELVPHGQVVDLFVVRGGEKKKDVLEN